MNGPQSTVHGPHIAFVISAFCFLLSAFSPIPLLAADPRFSELPGVLQSAPSASPLAPGAPAPAAMATTINNMDALDDKHKLAIGDKLSFRILEDLEDPKEPRDPRPLFVTDSGDIEIPYVGRVPAESKSCKQLAREIKTELEKKHYYQATVILAVDAMAKTRGRVYLEGRVKVPGPQEIPSDEVLTLSKAILRAGDFLEDANRHKVKVTRKPSGSGTEKKTFVVDVAKIFEEGSIERDLPLEPGDLIDIPERVFQF